MIPESQKAYEEIRSVVHEIIRESRRKAFAEAVEEIQKLKHGSRPLNRNTALSAAVEAIERRSKES